MAQISPEVAEHPNEAKYAYYLDKNGGLRHFPREDGFCRFKKDSKTKDIVDLYVAKGYRKLEGKELAAHCDKIKAAEKLAGERAEADEKSAAVARKAAK